MRSMVCALLCRLLLAGLSLFLSHPVPFTAHHGMQLSTLRREFLCRFLRLQRQFSPLVVFLTVLTHSHRLQQWLFVLVFAMKRQDVW